MVKRVNMINELIYIYTRNFSDLEKSSPSWVDPVLGPVDPVLFSVSSRPRTKSTDQVGLGENSQKNSSPEIHWQRP